MKLKLSSDRKVSPKSKFNSGSWTAEIPNAFGLPAHVSCPGKTEVCSNICYAFRLERAYTNVSKLLKHNWDLLQGCGNNVDQIVALLAQLIEDYLVAHARIERLRGAEYAKVFRIHWDGDFYSVAYAQAWAIVIADNPSIQFWAYTRSFQSNVNVVPALANIDNLSLYLSVDSANVEASKTIVSTYKDVKIAMLGDTFEGALISIGDLIGKKAPKCPEQTGRYPLVNTQQRGACVECMLCVNGVNNVLFSISKK